MQDEHDNDPSLRPAPGESRPRSPRIEVLGAGPASASGTGTASATDRRIEVLGGAAPAASPNTSPGSIEHPQASPRRRDGGLLRRPILLLALLGALILVGAVLYTASQQAGDREYAEALEREYAAGVERENAGTMEPVNEGSIESPAEAPVYDEPPAAPAPRAEAPAAQAAPIERAPPPPREVAVAEKAEAPAPEPAAATEAGGAQAAVRAFYGALSAGDGGSAAQLVVPAKRQSGPLSAGALSRYYSSFRRPLRLLRVTPVDSNTVRVAYDYVLADGRLCRGDATVDVVQSGGRDLVSGIRTRGPC